MPASISVDRSSRTPLQRQLFETLRLAIADGRLKPATRLPSTRELASELGVSRNCVVNAYRYLAAQGLIESRSGGGTRVSFAAPLRPRVIASTGPDRRRNSALKRLASDVSPGTPGPFRPGVGPVDLFPLRSWRLLATRVWRDIPLEALAYDQGPGDSRLRDLVAAHLGIAHGVRCEREQIIIVSGAQQAIDLSSRVLLEPGDAVCVEDPGYPGARSAFAAAAARIVAVPLDDEGFDVHEGRDKCPSPRLIYVTPSHQYPLGVVMSLPRRKALLQWAHETGAWLIEDSFGGELQRHGATETLYSLDSGSRVVFVGTFSQSLAPALRIGFLVVPPDLVSLFAAARAVSGRGTSLADQMTLARFMADGHFARHLRRVREACLERQRLLIDRLRTQIPGLIRIGGTGAGTHLVAYFETGIDDVSVARGARKLGVESPALRAYAIGAETPPALVLGYGSTPRDAIFKGVAALRAAVLQQRAAITK